MNKLDALFSQDVSGWGRRSRGFSMARLHEKEIREIHLTIHPHGWPKSSCVWCRFVLSRDKEWVAVNGEIKARHIKLLCHRDYEFIVPFDCGILENESFSFKLSEINTPVANFVKNILAQQRP